MTALAAERGEPRQSVWRLALAGLGLGTLCSAWPILLDASIGMQAGVRSAAFALILVAVALGTLLSGKRGAALVGPLALLGAAAGAMAWRASDGSPVGGLLAAGVALLPAAIAIGAALPAWIDSRAWLAGVGLGLGLGAAVRPLLGLPLCLVLAAVALVAGSVRRPPVVDTRGSERSSFAALFTATALGSALVAAGARLAVDVSLDGGGATRASLLVSGVALALISVVPFRGTFSAWLGATAAGAWWLGTSLFQVAPSIAAATSSSGLSVWAATTGLVAIPAALTARALFTLLGHAPPRAAVGLLGAACGLPIMTLLLQPAAGPRPVAAALACVLIAVSLVGAGRARSGTSLAAPLVAAGALSAIAGVAVGFAWNPQPTGEPAHVIDHRHGTRDTTTLWEHERDPALRWLTLNGLTIAQTYGGVDSLQQLLAHLPFVLRPADPPGRMLVVGQGMGLIADEALRHEALDELVVVEPSAAVLESAAAHSATRAERAPMIVQADPWIWLGDPSDSTRFDTVVVAGELLDPITGDDRLWTREFYRRCRARSTESGLVLRPVPLDLEPGALSIALQSFLLEFDHVLAWLSPPTHLILVGSSSAIALDPTQSDRVLRQPATANLRRYGWNDGPTLISMLTADTQRLATIAGNSAPHTLLRRSLAGFGAPAHDTRRINRAGALSRLSAVRPELSDWDGLAGYDVPLVEAQHRAASRLIEMFAVLGARRADDVEPALDALFEALRDAPTHGLTLGAIDSILPLAVELAPERSGVHAALGERLIAAGRAQEAETELREALRLDPRRGSAFALLGRSLAMQGDYHGAVTQLDNAIAFGADSPRGRFELAVALRLSGKRERAGEALEALLAEAPGDPALLEQRALLRLGGDAPAPEALDQALADAEQAVRAGGARQPGALHTLALALEATGRRDAATQTVNRALELARAMGASGLEPQLLATLGRLSGPKPGQNGALGN